MALVHLGQQRAGALAVLEALGVAPQAWTEPLPADVLSLFDKARDGRASVADVLSSGVEADVLDACGATPLWYAVRSLDDTAALLCWWVANVRWAAYRAREVVDVIELLLLGGAVATERQRELAAAAGVPSVVSALDA